MKSIKRIVSSVLVVIMLMTTMITAMPVTTSAATNGVQQKIDQIKAVYTDSTYFTANGNADYCSAHACDNCYLWNIPSRGGLPSGATAASAVGGGYSCNAFARYVFYCIFGKSYHSSPTTTTPVLGDLVWITHAKYGNHFGIYLAEDSSNYYIYNANGDQVKGVEYYQAHSKSSWSLYRAYHASNYNTVYGQHTCDLATYEYFSISHPHYNCYSCSFCGTIHADTSSSNYYSSCEECNTSIPEGIYYLKNAYFNQYVTVSGGIDQDGQNIYVADYTAGNEMTLRASLSDKGYVLQMLCSDSRVISPETSEINSTTNVVLSDYHQTLSQSWKFEPHNGGYVLRNVYDTNYVLDCNGEGNIVVAKYHGGTGQTWYLEPMKGSYYIKNSYFGQYVAVFNGIDQVEQNVCLTDYTGGSEMTIQMNATSDGYVFQPSCSSNRVISPLTEEINSATNVVLCDYDQTLRQSWKLENHNGGYVLRNVYDTNYVLDCNEEGNVVVAKYHGGAGQTWFFETASYHEHDYIINNSESPTCAKEGHITYLCSCSETYTELIPIANHYFINYISNNDCGCIQDGTKTAYCEYGCGIYDTIIDEGSASGHSCGEPVVTTIPTCTSEGVATIYCTVCNDIVSTETMPMIAHEWSDWIQVSAPTATEDGEQLRYCKTCKISDTEAIPATGEEEFEEPVDPNVPSVTSVNNYTVKIKNVFDVKEIRFARGEYTTVSQIKVAEGNLTLSASLAAGYIVDGVFTYDVAYAGTYTFCIRHNDGTNDFIYVDVNDINTYLVSDGLRLTVTDMKAASLIKDMWIAEGTWTTYSEIKNNVAAGAKYQATSVKLANYFATNDFTYTTANPGAHTVVIRYNDGTSEALHIELTVDVPTFDVNGLQVTVGNIPGIKIIRTAYGEYNSVSEIKTASGVRNFNNKTAIKDAETYMVQYRENGVVTMIVEYATGYKHVEHINIQQKVPTFTQDGDKVTIGDLDGLVIVRYAPGTYKTSNGIKNAEGSKYVKADAIVDGQIVVTDLVAGTYTFCVQYDDESYNYYTVIVE